MKILKYIKSIVLLALVATCLTNCDEDEDVIIQEIVAGFTQTIEDDRGTIRFINTSENAQTYAWDFGDGTTSTEINPIKQYSESGTYTVQMTANNSSGQTKSFSDQIIVQVIKEVTVSSFDFDNADIDYSANTFGGASFEVVANPDESGSNAEASNVGAITNSGAAFEGIFFLLGAPIDLSSEKTIKMNFWSQEPIDVLLKLEKTSGVAVETTASHGGTGWEEISFNFASSDQFSLFTLFVDGPGTTAGTFYFDDIEQIETLNLPIPPTVAAPAPTQDAADVISIYSDAYTDVTNDGFNLYGAAAFEIADIGGDGALRYTQGDNGFQVIELGANQIDAATAGMTNFRFDLWFPNEIDASSDFLLKLVNIIDTTPSEAEILVTSTSSPAIAQGQWLQFDLSLADLVANTPLVGTANIQQVVIDLLSSGEVYIDNIYFYKDSGDGGGGSEGTTIVDLTFSDATSIDNWERIADANTAEATLEWDENGGVEGGALKVSGTNPSSAAGKAYIFQVVLSELDYDGATDVRLTFDLKLATPLTATAVQLQTEIPGPGVVNTPDLQNEGLNDTGFTSYSYDFSGVDAAANLFRIQFNLASGAVENASGELLIDNIKLVKIN